jgi:hypothetical protein
VTRASDPGRLSDATPQSPLGRLLASAERDVPSDQELAKLAGRLGNVLEPAQIPAAAAPGSPLWPKLGVAVGVAGLLVGGFLVSRRQHPVSPAPSQVSPSAVGLAPAHSVEATPSAPMPSSSPTVSLAESAPKPALLQKSSAEPIKSAASGADGPSEPVLLEQARRALVSSPATALALTNQHVARFPHGVLTQESEVIAIEALRRLGRSAEADRRAAAFAQAFPGSAHQRMVEDASPK